MLEYEVLECIFWVLGFCYPAHAYMVLYLSLNSIRPQANKRLPHTIIQYSVYTDIFNINSDQTGTLFILNQFGIILPGGSLPSLSADSASKEIIF